MRVTGHCFIITETTQIFTKSCSVEAYNVALHVVKVWVVLPTLKQ